MNYYWCVNSSGRPIGKAKLRESEEVFLTPSVVDGLGLCEQDVDFSISPDGSRPRRSSYFGGVEFVSCVANTPFCPKATLLRQTKALDARGLSMKVGLELEFYLLRLETVTESLKPGEHAYDLASVLDNESLFEEFLLESKLMDLNVSSLHAEGGDLQYEVSFFPSDPMCAAINLTMAKLLLTRIAKKYGQRAIFSPKPVKGHFGNGLHINFSISRQNSKGSTSKYAEIKFANGVAFSAGDFQSIYCPSIESSERLFDPSMKNTWTAFDCGISQEKRTGLIRYVARDGRYEFRLPDGATNIFSALSAVISSGIAGVESSKEFGVLEVSLAKNFEVALGRWQNLDFCAFGLSKLEHHGLAGLLKNRILLEKLRN